MLPTHSILIAAEYLSSLRDSFHLAHVPPRTSVLGYRLPSLRAWGKGASRKQIPASAVFVARL